ncbi:hypothetical protein [Methylobacterium mesophilicum]
MLVIGRRDREYVRSRTGERVAKRVYIQAGASSDEVVGTIASFDEGGEILVAMNAFGIRGTFGGDYHCWPDKRLGNLLQLRAVWVELDFYKKTPFRNRSPQEMVWEVLHRCYQEGIPAPSYIVSSGRGLHVVWLTEGVPSVALPAWRAVQKRLGEVFADMGPDTTAAAPTTNLRLVGTSNRGKDVRMLWPAVAGNIDRYVLRALADEILPYSPEECREYRARAVERKAVRQAAAATRKATGRQYELTADTYRDAIERDLWKVLDHRYPEGEWIIADEDDDGAHGRFLYAFARLWSCTLAADDLRAKVELHARRLGYRNPKDAVREAGSIIRRRVQVDTGVARKNRPGTGGYRFGPQRFVTDFGIDEDLARLLDLRILRPLSMKAERARERQAKVRLDKGAKPRTEAREARLAIGREAIALRESEGLTRPQLCDRLNVKPTLLDKAIAEAKAELAQAVQPSPKSGTSALKRTASRVSSRISAIVEIEPVALDAVMEDAYNPLVRDKAPPSEDKRPASFPGSGGPLYVRNRIRSA